MKAGAAFTAADFRRFLRSRIERTYPGYLAALLALAAGVALGRMVGLPLKGSYGWADLPYHLLLIQSWPFVTVTPWNYPTWFLSSLMFTYVAVWPLAWLLAKRLRGGKGRVFYAGGALAVWLALSPLVTDPGLRHSLQVTCEFLCGAALFLLYSEGSRIIVMAQEHLDKTAVLWAAVLALNTLMLNVGYVLLVLGMPFLLGGLTAEKSVTAWVLTRRPLLWMGRLSYAIFVSHALAQKALVALLPAARYADAPLSVRMAALAMTGGTVLAFALAVHHGVELPCTRFLKRRRRQNERVASRLEEPDRPVIGASRSA